MSKIETITVGNQTYDVGGGGADIFPTPSSSVTESAVVSAVNGALPANAQVASLFGVQQWSNVKNKVIEYNGTIGSTGIGTWQEIEDLLETPPSASDCASWGWWYDDYFKNPELDTANVKLDFSYEGDEELSIGAWYLNTDVGYLEVQFGNEVSDPSSLTIYAEFEITRNSIS